MFIKRNWWVWLLAGAGILAALLPVLIVYLEIRAEPPTTTLGWAKQGAAMAGTLIALLLVITSKKNETNHLSGLRIGREKTIKNWEMSSRSLVAAQRHINQAIAQNPAKRPDEAKQAIREVMAHVCKTVIGVFENIPEDGLTVTLGIPLDNRLEMKIVELTPHRANRLPGGKYAFPSIDSELHSMLEAFKKGQVIYTPDATKLSGMEEKEYRSVLSFPVVDHRRITVAVVNVDSVQIALFDKEDKKDGPKPDQASIILIYELIQPSLQLIVGALEHCDPYQTGAGS